MEDEPLELENNNEGEAMPVFRVHYDGDCPEGRLFAAETPADAAEAWAVDCDDLSDSPFIEQGRFSPSVTVVSGDGSTFIFEISAADGGGYSIKEA